MKRRALVFSARPQGLLLLFAFAGFLHIRGFLQLAAGLEERPVRSGNLHFLLSPGIVALPGLALLDLQRTKADDRDALLLLNSLRNCLQRSVMISAVRALGWPDFCATTVMNSLLFINYPSLF